MLRGTSALLDWECHPVREWPANHWFLSRLRARVAGVGMYLDRLAQDIPGQTSIRVTIRLSAKDADTLDKLRGGSDRATFLRRLLRAASTQERPRSTKRDHARTDPQAAIKLAEQMNGQALLDQARRLTTDQGAARSPRSTP